jgi:excisionase family DNA binding protein
MPDFYSNLTDYANGLGISVPTLRQFITAGRLPAPRVLGERICPIAKTAVQEAVARLPAWKPETEGK